MCSSDLTRKLRRENTQTGFAEHERSFHPGCYPTAVPQPTHNPFPESHSTAFPDPGISPPHTPGKRRAKKQQEHPARRPGSRNHQGSPATDRGVRFSTSCRCISERPFPAAEYSLAAVCQHSLTTWFQTIEQQSFATAQWAPTLKYSTARLTQYIVPSNPVNTICCVSGASSGKSPQAQFFPRKVQKKGRLNSKIPPRISVDKRPGKRQRLWSARNARKTGPHHLRKIAVKRTQNARIQRRNDPSMTDSGSGRSDRGNS